MRRVHTTIDDETLARLDARADARGISRARLLREAAIYADGLGAGSALEERLDRIERRLEQIERQTGLRPGQADA